MLISCLPYGVYGTTAAATVLAEMRAVEISSRVLRPEHPDTLNSLFNVAALYWEQGRLAEAEELEARRLDLSRKVIGVDHPDTLMNMHNLALTWYDMG